MTTLRKRPLTKRQQQQIGLQQHQRLHDENAGYHGLIISHYGKQQLVRGLEEPHLGNIWRCHARTNLPPLVTGDTVKWLDDETSKQGVITTLLPRRSLLTRPDRYHNIKPIAANIDLILIVFASSPTPSALVIDRYLVACEHAGIPCCLVLNKIDLLAHNSALFGLLNDYRHIGYPVLMTSEHQPTNELRQLIAEKTVVFVGQSGVGKSSLINRLAPEAELKVNTVSSHSDLGQHTTTASRLISLDGGGAVIDSPGIREFGLWHLSVDAIRAGFIELANITTPCQFRNCSHRFETGCAIRQATETGLILERRLESLYKLEEEALRPHKG